MLEAGGSLPDRTQMTRDVKWEVQVLKQLMCDYHMSFLKMKMDLLRLEGRLHGHLPSCHPTPPPLLGSKEAQCHSAIAVPQPVPLIPGHGNQDSSEHSNGDSTSTGAGVPVMAEVHTGPSSFSCLCPTISPVQAHPCAHAHAHDDGGNPNNNIS